MKLKDIVAKYANLSNEQKGKLIVLRSGGWLQDVFNPAEYPGGVRAPKFEVHDPEFSTELGKGYIEFCFSDDKERQRVDFEIKDLKLN